MNSRIFGLLGLAYKGKKVVFGEGIIDSLQKGKLQLLIIASDCSETTSKRLQNKIAFYKKKFVIYGTKYELGSAISKSELSSLGIVDAGIADKIINLLKVGD